MRKFRLPTCSHRGGRWIALGVAAAIVTVPGVASAQAPSLPSLPVLPGQVSAALPGASAACSRIIADDLTTLFTDLATPPPQLPTSLSDVLAALTAALGRPPTAAELVAALEGLNPGSLGGATLPSTDTQSGTKDSSALNDATNDPTGGTGGTGDTGGASAAAVTTGNQSDVPGDLQQLAKDFLQFCVPAPPSGLPSLPSTPSSSSGGQQQQSGTQNASQPVTQPTTEPVTQPVTQPVSYPSYAATGGVAPSVLRPASDQRPAETVPLSALAGILLVSTTAAVGVRFRARRSGR